jgi:hypothetical protein
MKAHPTDGLSLTFGVIFIAIVGWWALAKSIDLSLPNLGWFVAGALIVLGVLGLLGALRRQRSADEEPLPVRLPAPVSTADDRATLGRDTVDRDTLGRDTLSRDTLHEDTFDRDKLHGDTLHGDTLDRDGADKDRD